MKTESPGKMPFAVSRGALLGGVLALIYCVCIGVLMTVSSILLNLNEIQSPEDAIQSVGLLGVFVLLSVIVGPFIGLIPAVLIGAFIGWLIDQNIDDLYKNWAISQRILLFSGICSCLIALAVILAIGASGWKYLTSQNIAFVFLMGLPGAICFIASIFFAYHLLGRRIQQDSSEPVQDFVLPLNYP